MFELTALPARQGDGLWIRWGDEAAPHQMIIDMGTEEIGKKIRERLKALKPAQRKIDLLVVSHVDRDHIGGVLTCLAEADPLPSLEISDVWFNGFSHLSGGSVGAGSNLRPMGPAQGERLSTWLEQQAWNKAFDGRPVQRIPGEPLETKTLFDDLKITIIGPTPARLGEFIPTWKDEVEKALEKGSLTHVSPGLRPMGSSEPPVLEEPGDLEALAEKTNSSDGSEANGSSIALLIEYEGRRVLLSGDAFSQDLADGIEAVAGVGELLRLDVFKLPHHGSKKNVFKELVESVDCDRWLISTDGTQFKHPDDVAIARIISYSNGDTPLLSFNVRSTFNGWWDNDDWKSMYGYDVDYGTAEDGLTIDLSS